MRNRSERRVKGRCSAHRSTYGLVLHKTPHDAFPTARPHRTAVPQSAHSCRRVMPSGRCSVHGGPAGSCAGGLWTAVRVCVECVSGSLSDCVFMLYNRNIVACACLISSLLKLPGFKVVAPCSCTPYGSPHTVHTTLTHDLEHRGSQRRDTPTAVSDSDRARP